MYLKDYRYHPEESEKVPIENPILTVTVAIIMALTITVMVILAYKLFLVLVDSSADKALSNEQIIQETKKCIDAGMVADTYPAGYIQVEKVVCHPKK